MVPECKPEWNREAITVFFRLPSLMAGDKPCPQLQPSLNTGPPPDVGVADTSLPPPIENLVPLSYTLKDWVPFNSMKEYIYPRKSPIESLNSSFELPAEPEIIDQTQVLRGWLTETETQELLAIMEEDDSSLHGTHQLGLIL